MKRSAILYQSLIFLLLLVFLSGQRVINTGSVVAFTMSGPNYILEMGNLNSIAGSAEGSSAKIDFTSGETVPGVSTNQTTKVKSGFQHIHPLRGFSFEISQGLIDFGILSPTNPVTRNLTLTVHNRSSQGYSVTAFADHPLQSKTTGQVIPDTTCDNGACTQIVAGPWTSTLTYGFGYRCDPITVSECGDGFANRDTYKQFSDGALREPAEAVMASGTTGSNKQVKITYKANIAGTQPAGTYTNTITFIAVPSF